MAQPLSSKPIFTSCAFLQCFSNTYHLRTVETHSEVKNVRIEILVLVPYVSDELVFAIFPLTELISRTSDHNSGSDRSGSRTGTAPN